MLGAYDVKNMPRTAIKGKVLVEFVVEFTEGLEGEGKRAIDVMTTLAFVIPPEKYTLMVQLTEKG